MGGGENGGENGGNRDVIKFPRESIVRTPEKIAAIERGEPEYTDPLSQLGTAMAVVEKHSSSLSDNNLADWQIVRQKTLEDEVQRFELQYRLMTLQELGTLLVAHRNQAADAPKDAELVAIARAYRDKSLEKKP